jgi:predicted CxxxxCH...CXXCH cytochrome family protein
VAADGALVPPPAGRHLDGAVQSVGGHSQAFKTDTASAEFHAFEANRALAGCAPCHGAELEGGSGTACAECHGADWKTACVMCHGGTANATGAPPKATWGNPSPIAVGAHTAHVAATHNLSPAFGCEYCHPKPATPLAAGHANGAVEVTGYTGADAVVAGVIGPPGWSGTSCATSYCHAGVPLGLVPQPAWTSTSAVIRSCTGCHPLPPNDGPLVSGFSAHKWHVVNKGKSCSTCHNGFTSSTVNPALHSNGRRDVIVKGAVFTGGWPACGPCHALFPPPPPEE